MSWIKLDKETSRKPEISAMMRILQKSRAEVFLAFVNFLCWADTQTEDGTLKLLTAADVDEIAGQPGFGKALETVNWITFYEASAVITNWSRHNGSCAKKRLSEATRKSLQRAAVAKADAEALVRWKATADKPTIPLPPKNTPGVKLDSKV